MKTRAVAGLSIRWAWGAAALLALAAADLARALDPTKELLDYNCRTWTRLNGLPVNGIKTITQSRDGYLWLGTAVGLLRFDGLEFNLIDLAHVPGIRSSIVTSLANANDGGLWVGLQDGAFGHYDGRVFSPRGRESWGGLNLDVRSVKESADGTLWVAAHRLAARIAPTGDFTPIMVYSEQFKINILAHFADSRGRQWFATASQGLHYWQDGKLVRLPDSSFDTTLSMAEDREGNLWIAGSASVQCLDAELRKKEAPPLGANPRTLLVDRSGTLWVGTDGAGLARYRDGAYSFLKKADGLANDYVSALREDDEGDLWVGTRGGLSQLADVKFATRNAAEDPAVLMAAGVAASARGGVWVGSGGGVTYFDGATRKTYSAAAGLPPGTVKRVFEASNGDVYLVCGQNTLAILSGDRVVAVHRASTLVVGMVEDAQGVIVSVGGQLYRANREGLTPYAFAGAPPGFRWILNLAPGADGAFWVASEAGIFRVKDGIFRQWSVAEGLPEPNALAITEDRDGVVWASTLTSIVRLKDDTVRLIRRKDGLFDDNIYAIVPDDFGNLWIDAGRGIFRVSRAEMNDFAEGRIGRIESVAYDGLDSVKTADKTTSQERVGCRSRDGRIWFPSARGVVVIDPANIPTNRRPPAVHIGRVLANGAEIAREALAVVPPGPGALEFHFTALSFPAPQRVKIRYRLEGYDQDWIETESRREAFYTNLRPGSYRFQVIAANSDDVWNRVGDAQAIELRPHFYQTAWFYALGAGGALAALAAAYSWRLRHIRRKQRELRLANERLEREVAHRTSELARANASLQEVIAEQKHTEAQLLQKKRSLENEIEESRRLQREIERVQGELLKSSRQAGMAEVATGVLHNVGNVLNSVNVSATLVSDQLRGSKVSGVGKLAAMFRQHEADLADFLTRDARGQMVPGYLGTLAESLATEQKALLQEVEHLRANIEHIKEVVAMQQEHAKNSGFIEAVALAELVEDALRINASSFARADIELVRDFQVRPTIDTDRHKVVQILVNLVRNAQHACEEAGGAGRRIVAQIAACEGQVAVSITDNGVGIPAENLTRIFNHGFTTKKNGHGFGLHSGALAAKELGGALTVRSAGLGSGATFTLMLPLAPAGVFPTATAAAAAT